MVQLKELRTNDRNPRIIKSEQFAKLVKSVKEFPEMMKLRPLVVTDNGEVIGGNMRYRALESLGYEEIPDDWVMYVSNFTEEQRKRFIISDNIIMGEWDFDIVFSDWDIEELKDWGFDVSLLDLPDTMLSDNEEEESKEETSTLKKYKCPKCGFEFSE